jgi:uncharacterized phage-associated protein
LRDEDCTLLYKGAAMNEPYDSRAIANLILDEGHRIERPITNLALQKLLYFAHGLFLIERKRALVSGYFEAWKFGPVHPTAYQAFKSAGDRPITFRALRQNLLTGEVALVPAPTASDVRAHVARIMSSYGSLTPGRLIDVSHAKNAPWAFVVEKGRTGVAFGLRITDDVILSRFKHHKIPIGDAPIVGEPGEDTPFT